MELSFHFHNFLFHIIDAQSSTIITHYPVVEIIVVFKISSSTDLSEYKINSGENLVIPTVLHTSRFLFCFVIWRCNLFLRQVKRVEELTVNTTVVYHINTHTDISTPVVFRNTSDHRNTIVKRPFSDSVVPSQATLFGFFNINGTLLCSADWRVCVIDHGYPIITQGNLC